VSGFFSPFRAVRKKQAATTNRKQANIKAIGVICDGLLSFAVFNPRVVLSV
jgi:hypothetical protein